MFKMHKNVKKALSIALTILLSMQSFAAVVADNDGSAFITKAEFDSLKNNFQSQIDNYNTSIDSKIDGAIAAYLAGIKTAVSVELDLLYEKNYKFGREHLWWYKKKDCAVNFMGVHFMREKCAALGSRAYSYTTSPYWSTSVTDVSKKEIFNWDYRLNITNESAKTFDEIKKFEETLSFFLIFVLGASPDTGSPATNNRRYMDMYLLNKLNGKKWNTNEMAIFAENSVKVGNVSVSYNSVKLKKEDAEKQKYGISQIYSYPDYGMLNDRLECGDLGWINQRCWDETEGKPGKNSSIETIYNWIYSKMQEKYSKWKDDKDYKIPKADSYDGTRKSSYDGDIAIYNGNESGYFTSPMDYYPDLASSIIENYATQGHAGGYHVPCFDTAPKYVGHLNDWNNSNDNTVAGEVLPYGYGRIVTRVDNDGVVTLKFTAHGNGRFNFYAAPKGNKLWTDERNNDFGSCPADGCRTETAYDDMLNSWPDATKFLDEDKKTIKINVKKGDKIFVNVCPTDDNGAWLEFTSANLKIDS